ncbi:cytochrome c oxidase assembly factor Coa1 family protein [uncultured Dokdonia sp.]|uniref:cytochrome c oxidase assembly factor Coa1 family protein n=1 Tax=uncultured Dokdonia sp. TaxID=575653 RepID=UPI00262A0977|nr:cytochrome c oxidase assembly factor Coa1 family protein [uncultured Dokdonia sp.]
MEEEIRQSWWKRNWKWALPSGGCLTILIVIAIFIGVAFNKVSKRTSIVAYINIVTKLQTNKEVAQALGKPIEILEEGYDPESSKDHLDIQMQLDGQKADGTLIAKAEKIDGEWVYSMCIITIEGTNQVIDIKDSLND